MSKQEFTVYDPREGHSFEWRTPDGRLIFSGASSRTYVVEAVGIDWDFDLIGRIFETNGTHGIMAVSPWAPGADSLVAQLRSVVPNLVAAGDIHSATFPYSTQLLNQILAVRDQRGGWASGEWCLGVLRREATSAFSARRDDFGGLLESLAFSSPHALGAVLVLRDFGSILAVHLNDESEKLLTQLGTDLAKKGKQRNPTESSS